MEPRRRILRRAVTLMLVWGMVIVVAIGLVMFVNAGPEPEVRFVDSSRSVQEFQSTRDCDELVELMFDLRRAGLDTRTVLEAWATRVQVVGCR